MSCLAGRRSLPARWRRRSRARAPVSSANAQGIAPRPSPVGSPGQDQGEAEGDDGEDQQRDERPGVRAVGVEDRCARERTDPAGDVMDHGNEAAHRAEQGDRGALAGEDDRQGAVIQKVTP